MWCWINTSNWSLAGRPDDLTNLQNAIISGVIGRSSAWKRAELTEVLPPDSRSGRCCSLCLFFKWENCTSSFFNNLNCFIPNRGWKALSADCLVPGSRVLEQLLKNICHSFSRTFFAVNKIKMLQSLLSLPVAVMRVDVFTADASQIGDTISYVLIHPGGFYGIIVRGTKIILNGLLSLFICQGQSEGLKICTPSTCFSLSSFQKPDHVLM